MALATFDFEGGSNNTNATTGTTGATGVIPGTGGTIKHQTSAAVHGALGLELITGTSGGCYVEFNDTVIDEAATGTIRFAYRLPTTSLNATPSIFQANGASAGTTTVLRLQLTTGDVLQMQDSGSAHTVTGPDMTAYMGSWIGIAIQFYTGTTSTNATTTVRVYASPTALAGDYLAEFSSTANLWNLGGSSSTAWPLKLLRVGVNQAQSASRTVAVDYFQYVDSATWLDGTAKFGSVVMSGGGTLGVSGTVTSPSATVSSSVTMSGSGVLSVGGHKEISPSVVMSGSGVLSVSGSQTQLPAVVMAGAGVLSVSGSQVQLPAVVMAGAGTLLVAPLVTAVGGVTMSGAGTLTVAALTEVLPAILMAGAGSLTAIRSHSPPVLFVGSGTLAVVTTSGSRVVFYGLSAAEGSTTVNSRVIFYGLSASDQGTLQLALAAPTQVDPFELVDVVATVSGGVSLGGISWEQRAGKVAEVLDVVQIDEATYRLRFYAPADIDPGSIAWRATVDGNVAEEVSMGIWPADLFASTPAGEWVPDCTYESYEE